MVTRLNLIFSPSSSTCCTAVPQSTAEAHPSPCLAILGEILSRCGASKKRIWLWNTCCWIDFINADILEAIVQSPIHETFKPTANILDRV